MRKAGLLYGVAAPWTKTKVFEGSLGSHGRTSGGKKIGAAVLARTSCQRGICKLQSLRSRWLYLASGLLETGQGESVVTLRVTARKRQQRSSGARVVFSPKVFCSSLARGSDL